MDSGRLSNWHPLCLYNQVVADSVSGHNMRLRGNRPFLQKNSFRGMALQPPRRDRPIVTSSSRSPLYDLFSADKSPCVSRADWLIILALPRVCQSPAARRRKRPVARGHVAAFRRTGAMNRTRRPWSYKFAGTIRYWRHCRVAKSRIEPSFALGSHIRSRRGLTRYNSRSI